MEDKREIVANILLIEPAYKVKQPPLGLMKISAFHKSKKDHVVFIRGKLPDSYPEVNWDRVYVSSLFTYEWKKTIEAIEYAKTLVDSNEKVIVGGILATLMPEEIQKATGIQPVRGLLDESGKLGLSGDEEIDELIPDYSIINEKDYAFSNAYFLSATKGCGNRCGFCAVQMLEPDFKPYSNIKWKIEEIDRRYGKKKDLILMDNNVLRSPYFDEIIDDIIEAGFGKGASYKNPKTGRTVRRYVDFNQGLDAMFLTEEKAKRLGEIALKPVRIAFDHIEDAQVYTRAMRLCAKYGLTNLSNYVLYNGNDFTGKGKRYKADTPKELYERMRITLDLCDEFNEMYDFEKKFQAFSFPMKFIPLDAKNRKYIGPHWNAKFLRAVQAIMVATHGKSGCSRSYFEMAFGKDSDEFVRILCMPENLIMARGKTGRKDNAVRIREWNDLFNSLDVQERDEFIELISDNRFSSEKLSKVSSDLQRDLYRYYLNPIVSDH